MKAFICVISLIFLTQLKAVAQTKFVLEPTQSMLMTGKGTGQDATINPFSGKNCYAIVKNIGKRKFSIRVQKKGKAVEETTIYKGGVKEVYLAKGYELYLDPNPEGIARASIDYKKAVE